MNAIRYIYQNPVRAGIVKKVEDYPYSSLGFYLGTSNLGIKLKPDSYTQDLIKQGFDDWKKWILLVNNPLLENDVELLKDSFGRMRFGFSIRQLRSAESNGTELII